MPITVATTDNVSTLDNCCTKCGFLPLSLPDGTIYWQLCCYCTHVVETIISPQAVLTSSDVFTSWTQTRYKDGRPGTIQFNSDDGFLTMKLTLAINNGLYCCPTDVFTMAPPPTDIALYPYPTPYPSICRVAQTTPASRLQRSPKYRPTSKSRQLESELWLLQLGSPGVTMLNALPGNVTGIPATFDHHPFRFVDFKAQAGIQKEAAQCSAICTTKR
jgi:hypothetical protein